MVRPRLEIAHAALVDVLRELAVQRPDDRRSFADCLAAARLVGGCLEREREEDDEELLLQVA